MKEWIKEEINPPGIGKANRGGLYGVIGEVFGSVKEDALKAFNAYFPYLADEQKLAEHGKSLFIPRFPNDTQEEYRERVATASFYLSRAGERGYIVERLKERFGERFIVIEEFLDVFIRINELTDTERQWLLGFLDELINPVVKLTAIGWYKVVEQVMFNENLSMQGSITLNDTFKRRRGVKLDGKVKLDGSVKLSRGIKAMLDITAKFLLKDEYKARIKLNGHIKLDRREKLTGLGRINDRVVIRGFVAVKDNVEGSENITMTAKANIADSVAQKDNLTMIATTGYSEEYGQVTDGVAVGIRYKRKLDGKYKLNGEIKLNSGILIPM
jgi:hypothetical protein